MKQPESHPWRKGFPPRQLCELCGQRPATHTVTVERTIGGSGDPEVDVEVERSLCDQCNFFELAATWARINNEWSDACLACDDSEMARLKGENLIAEIAAVRAYRRWKTTEAKDATRD